MFVFNFFNFFQSIFSIYFTLFNYFISNFNWIYLCLKYLLNVDWFKRICTNLCFTFAFYLNLFFTSHVLHISKIYSRKDLDSLSKEIIKLHVVALFWVIVVLHWNKLLLFLFFWLSWIHLISNYRILHSTSSLIYKFIYLFFQFVYNCIFFSYCFNWSINCSSVLT